MRTFSLVLLGLAVGAALLSRSPRRPAPRPRSLRPPRRWRSWKRWSSGSGAATSGPSPAPASPAPPRAPGWSWSCTTKKCTRSRPGRSFWNRPRPFWRSTAWAAGQASPATTPTCWTAAASGWKPLLPTAPASKPTGKTSFPKLPGRDERSGRPHRRRPEKRPAAIHPLNRAEHHHTEPIWQICGDLWENVQNNH